MKPKITVTETPPTGLVYLTCPHSTPTYPIVWVSENKPHKVSAAQARLEDYCLTRHSNKEIYDLSIFKQATGGDKLY